MTTSPIVKTFIIAVFVMILASLATAFFSLFKGRDRDGTTAVKALTVRVALSIGLVIVLGILYALGMISPNG